MQPLTCKNTIQKYNGCINKKYIKNGHKICRVRFRFLCYFDHLLLFSSMSVDVYSFFALVAVLC